MAVRPVVTGITLIFTVFLLVFLVEHFIPFSVKADMDMVCRRVLLRMENAGGLSDTDRQELREELEQKGFTGVAITASSGAKQGGLLTLRVEGDYTFSKITSLFKRNDVKYRFVYDKTSMSRKVVN
ncbi:MAG: hypothetical protein ACOX4M_00645 [Acetivibrionales bacterium]|jgi:hypothetical protein